VAENSVTGMSSPRALRRVRAVMMGLPLSELVAILAILAILSSRCSLLAQQGSGKGVKKPGRAGLVICTN
jgi:hypothetical protein